MTEYVVGFPLNEKGDTTILIKKNRPEWQKGYWNGIGGHIEEGETPSEAMSREFLEEAGAVVKPENWTCYMILTDRDWKVYFFYTTINLDCCQQKTDEKIFRFATSYLPANCISGLFWLVPIAVYHREFPQEFSSYKYKAM